MSTALDTTGNEPPQSLQIDADLPAGSPPVSAPGNISVRGSVRAGVCVRAGGSMLIEGSVEGATLHAGADITIRGTLIGARDAHIACAGTLRARLINNADIEAEHDLWSELEIAHSRVICGGAVRCPIGHILGGHITANAGVSCGTLGSPGVGGAPTIVEVAIDEALRRASAAHCPTILANLDRITKVRTKVHPLMAHLKQLTPQQKETATELLAEAAALEEATSILAARLKTQIADSLTRAARTLFVAAAIHPGTTIRFPVAQMIVEKQTKGPFRITADGKGASAKVLMVNPADRQPISPKFSLYTDGPTAELQRALVAVETSRQPTRKAA